MRVEDTEWFRFSAEARKRISEAGEEEKSGAKFYFEARKMIEKAETFGSYAIEDIVDGLMKYNPQNEAILSMCAAAAQRSGDETFYQAVLYRKEPENEKNREALLKVATRELKGFNDRSAKDGNPPYMGSRSGVEVLCDLIGRNPGNADVIKSCLDIINDMGAGVSNGQADIMAALAAANGGNREVVDAGLELIGRDENLHTAIMQAETLIKANRGHPEVLERIYAAELNRKHPSQLWKDSVRARILSLGKMDEKLAQQLIKTAEGIDNTNKAAVLTRIAEAFPDNGAIARKILATEFRKEMQVPGSYTTGHAVARIFSSVIKANPTAKIRDLAVVQANRVKYAQGAELQGEEAIDKAVREWKELPLDRGFGSFTLKKMTKRLLGK